MQFGLDLPAHWPNPAKPIETLFPELIEAAKLGEQIGFSSFVLAEHHFIDYFVMPAPLVLASHLAALTKDVKLVVSVFALPLHDVRRLAGEIAVADHLTGGRLEIGLGRGGARYELTRMGITTDRVLDMFNEKRDALILLLSKKDVSFEGEFVQFPPLTIMPPPLQKPYPPVWMSVIRAEAAYHCAKNGYNVQTALLRRSFADVREVIQAFKKGCAEAGPAGENQKISLGQWIYVAKDDRDAAEKKRMAHQNHKKFMNLFTTDGMVLNGETQPIEIKETVEQIADSAIIGMPDFCIDRILDCRSLGIDQLFLRMHFGPDSRDIMSSLDRFGEHVLPHVAHGAAPQPKPFNLTRSSV